MQRLWNWAVLGSVALFGCAGEKDQSSNLTWKGEIPHFAAQGRLDGEDLDFAIDGEVAADGSGAWCVREYQTELLADGSLDLAQAKGSATSLEGFATIGGESRSFALEFRNHALQDDAVGVTIPIVSRDSATHPSEAVLDWEWHLGELTLFEASAQEGSFHLDLFSGAPGEGGVVIPAGEGSVGGLLKARWSVDEFLNVSFTLPCLTTEVESE